MKGGEAGGRGGGRRTRVKRRMKSERGGGKSGGSRGEGGGGDIIAPSVQEEGREELAMAATRGRRYRVTAHLAKTEFVLKTLFKRDWSTEAKATNSGILGATLRRREETLKKPQRRRFEDAAINQPDLT